MPQVPGEGIFIGGSENVKSEDAELEEKIIKEIKGKGLSFGDLKEIGAIDYPTKFLDLVIKYTKRRVGYQDYNQAIDIYTKITEEQDRYIFLVEAATIGELGRKEGITDKKILEDICKPLKDNQ